MLAALALVTVFAFGLCWVFAALAMVVREPRSVQGLGALVMLPLTFGSNVFVPTSTLPGWLQGFVEINRLEGRRRGSGAAHRRRGGGAGHDGADRVGGAGRGSRAAGGGALPPAHVIVTLP